MNLKSEFLLDPNITYLNFGSFGACPKTIFNDYMKWQLELEREPAQFFNANSGHYLEQSRNVLGDYINCDKNDVVFVPNPSYAINIIAKSIDLQPGDEILSTNLEYGACDRTWDYYCEKKAAKYVRQHIQLPLVSKEQFIEDFFKGLTTNTKAIFISHITSTTALILPVKEICEIAKTKGLLTIVDGAHAPGHVPLDIQLIDADMYTGACHKWMLAPKGCSFLYVRKTLQSKLDPLVVSWGYKSTKPSESLFLDYHQMPGTRDFSAYLTVPACVQFMDENNWEKVAESCRQMVIKNAERFFHLLSSKPLAPLTDVFIGQMLSIKIKTKDPEQLQLYLFRNYLIEIPVMRHGDAVYLRYSINAFNDQNDLNRLYNALKELIEKTDLLEV
jgi:isopenicillin-N epimerase